MPLSLVEPAIDCPAEGTLAAYGDQRLSPAERAAVDLHLDRCARCELAVAMFRSAERPVPSEEADASLDRFVARLASAQEFRPGTRAGRYVVLDVVGRGAMGVVYAAHDPELDRNVALKILLGEAGDGGSRAAAREKERVLREARAMAKLAHPNVVTVHDVGVANGRVFMAMELVAGRTLAEWMRPRRSAVEIVAMFIAVGDALAAAHAAGIIHRDLKPQNVLVTPDGRPKITDFGIAEATRTLEGSSASTIQTVAWAGTPAYMAPEIFRGERADERLDQFAFAICLHEALSGKRTIEAETVGELGRRVVAGAHVIDGSLSRDLRSILTRALATSRGARYPSMAELTRELARARLTTYGPRSIVALVSAFVLLGVMAAGLGFSWAKERGAAPAAIRIAPFPAAFGAPRAPAATGVESPALSNDEAPRAATVRTAPRTGARAAPAPAPAAPVTASSATPAPAAPSPAASQDPPPGSWLRSRR